MQKKWSKILSVMACLAMLCALLPTAAVMVSATDAEPIVGGVQTSVRDSSLNSNGLAFRFTVNATGALVEGINTYINGSAKIGDALVVRSGAVVTNSSSTGLGDMTLESVNNKKTIDIQAKFLCDVAADTFSFAVRIVDIPNHKLDSKIYVRPYVMYLGADGTETVAYGETVAQTYNGAAKPEEDETHRQVKELLQTKHPLIYNEDGSFRVLILADAHMNTNGNAKDVQEVKDRIKLLVDNEQPDLVIYTGDNTINSYTEESMRKNLDAIVGYVEEKQIPWCHVYGNHDEEYGMSKEKQQAVYESYEYCVSKAGPEDLFGVGNYVLGVYKQDGSLGSVIYCLDSGAYASGGGYDYLKDNQVEWYKQTSVLLQEYNGGNVVPGMMAFHIPLYENRLAYNNRNNKDIVSEWNGERNEDICSSKSDMNAMFETMLERGDIKAAVSGHDHVNDYMFNYYGIKLCSSPNISDLEYHDHAKQGGRVFDLNLDTIDNILTHVTRLESLYPPEVPVEYETLANNVSLELKLESAEISAWNGGAVDGTVNINLSANGGPKGSPAIEIKRSNKENFEVKVDLANQGKLGNNKYLLVWADFTNVEFRKSCFGLQSEDETFRTDDADYKTAFYYLPDGSSEWQTLYHGEDGCYGKGDSGSQAMQGKKGYFAFPVQYFLCSSAKMTADTPVTGLYYYASLDNNSTYFNKPYYFSDIRLVVDYKDAV